MPSSYGMQNVMKKRLQGESLTVNPNVLHKKSAVEGDEAGTLADGNRP